MPAFDGRSIDDLEKVAERQWHSRSGLEMVLHNVHLAAGNATMDKERLRTLSQRIKRRLNHGNLTG